MLAKIVQWPNRCVRSQNRRYDRFRMSGSGRGDGIDYRRYLRQAWRRKWILLALVVLIPLAAYLITNRQPKVYEASTLMKVAPQNISVSNTISFGSSGVTETATIIKTSGVARLAARELGEPPSDAGALLSKISTGVEGDSTDAGFLRITAKDNDPGQAARIANAFAASITQTRTNDAIGKIDATIATLTKQAPSNPTVSDQIDQLRATRA